MACAGNGADKGTFSAATNFGVGDLPESVSIGDFNGDGNQDLAVTNDNSVNVSILLGDGSGSFAAATNVTVGLGPRYASVADLNGDGDQDLVVVNRVTANVSILLGDGTGG